jgi:hypothetical protein
MQLGPGRPLLTAPPPLEERSTGRLCSSQANGRHVRPQAMARAPACPAPMPPIAPCAGSNGTGGNGTEGCGSL